MPFELTIHEGGGPARRQVLSKDVVFLGRREDNDVVLPYTFVSSRHGRLFLREGCVFAEDMGSTNGTLLNGEPLTPMAARALRPDDRLLIGEIAIQVRWTEGAPRPEPEALTFHELPRHPGTPPLPAPRPAAISVAASAPEAETPPPVAESLVPVLADEPQVPAARSPPPPPAWERQGTAHLGQTSLTEALATSRATPRGEPAEPDPYRRWEIFFKTVGLGAILAGLLLLVFALVA